MDEKIQKVLEEKIHESTSRVNEITSLVKSFTYEGKLTWESVFRRGIIIGRLYNSFHYQSRRILKRNPTEKELSEFTELLKKHETEFSQLFLS